MDAIAIVAASIAIQQAIPAAVEEALREVELSRMRAEDLHSYLAQHRFTENLQLRRRSGAMPETWQTVYTRAHNLIMDLRMGIRRALFLFVSDLPGSLSTPPTSTPSLGPAQGLGPAGSQLCTSGAAREAPGLHYSSPLALSYHIGTLLDTPP